jgi:hypothetical protein
MKSGIRLVTGFMALTLFSQPAMAQLTNQTPARPRPETGKPQPPGTVTGGTQNIINSKLLVYAKNGIGTNYTNTGGEFPSQLVASATVNSQFSLQWSRAKPGATQNCNLFIYSPNSTAVAFGKSVTMPAQSVSVDINYSVPNLAPKTYEMKVVCDSGSSSKVRVNYTGNGASSSDVAITPAATSSVPLQTAKVKVTAAKFTPRVGTQTDPNYQDAKLVLTLVAEADSQIQNVSVEVYSEPFMNSEYVTTSGSKNSPIKLFSGHRALGYTIHPGTPKTVTIILYRTSKAQVNAQEAGPGIYSPGDWNLAYGQTTTASFRWTVDGQSGSFEQSPKKQWQSP